ncbi:BppU family phage baseplate upper protein [Vagococcus sp.]
MIFKDHVSVMNVDIHNDEIESTKAVVRSFDYDTGKFTYKLTKDGVPLSLSGASKVNVTLMFGGDAKAILDATTVDSIESIISFVYPEQFLSYSGQVLGEVSIQYSNGQSLVAGYFSLVVKGANIDDQTDLKQRIYVERFEDLESMITKQAKEVDVKVGDMTGKVTEIEKKIEENDLVTKPEAGKLEDFREQDFSIIEKLKNESIERGANIKWYGALGDGKTDDSNAFNEVMKMNDVVVIPSGIYHIKQAHIPKNKTIIGIGKVVLNLSKVSQPVLGGIQDNVTVHNIIFNSLEENLEWNRIDITNKKHITLVDCSFVGFRHPGLMPNSWGVYIDKSKFINLIRCGFDDNTQSDITIVEGCSHINIDSCFNYYDIEKGIHINIEPNASDKITENVSIRNTKMSKYTCWEYQFTFQSTKNILVENCEILKYNFFGGDTTFINSIIRSIITKKIAKDTILFGARIKMNGALNLSSNLILDDTASDFSLNKPARWGMQYFDGSLKSSINRIKENGKTLIRLGDLSRAGSYRMRAETVTGDNLNVKLGDQFAITLEGYSKRDEKTNWPSIYCQLAFYDVNDLAIPDSTVWVSMQRLSKLDTVSDFSKMTTFVTITDERIKKMRLILTNGKDFSNGELYISGVSLQQVLWDGKYGNSDISEFSHNNPLTLKTMPTNTSNHINFFKGEKVYVLEDDMYVGAIPQESGHNVNFKKFGKIE